MTRSLPLVCALSFAAMPLAAQDWEFRITPYLWFPAFETKAEINGSTTTNSGDVLDYLDRAFLITGEARRGAFSLVGEYNWLDLSDGIDDPEALRGSDLRLSGRMMALALGWAFMETPQARLDAIGGVRYWDMKVELDAKDLGKPSVSNEIVDPIIGVRGEFQINDRWAAASGLNIGGFGVGSDFQTDFQLRASYAFTDATHGVIGYRYLDVDLGNDDAIESLLLSGPYLAVDFRF